MFLGGALLRGGGTRCLPRQRANAPARGHPRLPAGEHRLPGHRKRPAAQRVHEHLHAALGGHRRAVPARSWPSLCCRHPGPGHRPARPDRRARPCLAVFCRRVSPCTSPTAPTGKSRASCVPRGTSCASPCAISPPPRTARMPAGGPAPRHGAIHDAQGVRADDDEREVVCEGARVPLPQGIRRVDVDLPSRGRARGTKNAARDRRQGCRGGVRRFRLLQRRSKGFGCASPRTRWRSRSWCRGTPKRSPGRASGRRQVQDRLRPLHLPEHRR